MQRIPGFFPSVNSVYNFVSPLHSQASSYWNVGLVSESHDAYVIPNWSRGLAFG